MAKDASAVVYKDWRASRDALRAQGQEDTRSQEGSARGNLGAGRCQHPESRWAGRELQPQDQSTERELEFGADTFCPLVPFDFVWAWTGVRRAHSQESEQEGTSEFGLPRGSVRELGNRRGFPGSYAWIVVYVVRVNLLAGVLVLTSLGETQTYPANETQGTRRPWKPVCNSVLSCCVKR